MADQFADASNEVQQSREAVNDAAGHGQRAVNEALGAAARTIGMATQAAERSLRDSLEAFRAQTSSYMQDARGHLDDGQHYVADQVKQRPMTATLAGLGVGFMLGVLLSNRSR